MSSFASIAIIVPVLQCVYYNVAVTEKNKTSVPASA